VSSFGRAGSGERFGAGDEGVLSEVVTEPLVGGFGDADARSDEDFFCEEAVFANPQTGSGRGEVGTVVSSSGDAEGFGEAPWAAGEFGKIARTVQRDFAGASHGVDAFEGFEGAEED